MRLTWRESAPAWHTATRGFFSAASQSQQISSHAGPPPFAPREGKVRAWIHMQSRPEPARSRTATAPGSACSPSTGSPPGDVGSLERGPGLPASNRVRGPARRDLARFRASMTLASVRLRAGGCEVEPLGPHAIQLSFLLPSTDPRTAEALPNSVKAWTREWFVPAPIWSLVLRSAFWPMKPPRSEREWLRSHTGASGTLRFRRV